MNAVLSWLGARLAEPSTWAGIATAATSIQQAIGGNTTALGGVIAGLLAMVIPEKSTTTTPPKGS